MNYYNYIFSNILLLIVWFKTDAFVEYSKLFRLSKLFKVDIFEKEKSQDFELTYHSYLRRFHNNFFVRLITCPICLTIWLCMPVLFYNSNLELYSFTVLIDLIIYYLLSKLIDSQ